MTRPRVSFVVPCYNYAAYLAQAVDSLLTQSFEDVEVIIIDDASSDNTGEVMSRYASNPRVRLVRHESNKGNIATYNEGIGLARGEFVGLLSADDYALPGAVGRQVAVFDSDPEIGFVHFCYAVVDGAGTVRSHLRPHPADALLDGDEEFANLCGGNFVCHSGTLVRKSFHDKLGVYDPNLPIAADWDLWIRLAKNGKVGYIAEPLYAYRQHSVSMSKTVATRKAVLNDLWTIQRAFEDLPTTSPLQRLRPKAFETALLNTCRQTRSRGLIRSSWSALYDAVRVYPPLLARPGLYSALLRCLLLTVTRGKLYEQLAQLRSSLAKSPDRAPAG